MHATSGGLAWLSTAHGKVLLFVQGPGDDSAFGASVVPVPAAILLFGSGLIGLIGVARRKVHA